MRSLTGLAVALLVAAAVGLGFYAGDLSLAVGGPGPTAFPTFSPVPSRTPKPVETVAPDDLHVFSVGEIPLEYRFALVGDPGDERLLLLDLAGKRIKLAAHFTGKGAFDQQRVIELTSTASGDTFVIHLRATGPDARLYIIRPITGEVRSLLIPRSESPRLSPDAQTIAVSRNSDDPEAKGLWLLSTSDGTGRRLTTDVGRRATRPVQWTGDGKRLSALLDGLDFTRQLVVIDPATGGVSAPIGRASDARWRGNQLFFWNANVAGTVSVYDTVSGVTREAFPPREGVIVDRAEVKPGSDDLAVRERGPSFVARLVVYRSGVIESIQMADAQRVVAFWWALGGSRLYAWSIDNETMAVRDLLSETTSVTFCFRVKIDPPCG